MKNCSVVHLHHFRPIEGEPLFKPESDHLLCSYVRLSSAGDVSFLAVLGRVFPGRRVRAVVRQGLTGSTLSGPKRDSRFTLRARAAVALITIGAFVSVTQSAEAASKTTKAPPKTKTTVKRKTPTRAPTTVKRVATTLSTTTQPSTSTPKLSSEARAVLSGYEAYLVAMAAAAHNPERAEQLLPPGVTGDALARLIELARFNIAEGQYWDGERADILSSPRVQSVGLTRSTVRDCRSVGGVLRKRSTNDVVPGSTDPDVDDLIVDLVKLNGRWVVTRTDRSNAEEGKGTCVPASSP